MNFDQYFQQAVMQTGERADCSMKKWRSSSDAVTSSDVPSADFECNICFDMVQEPVVTLCGHLYCWPCIYKWLHLQNTSDDDSSQCQQQCPVCKAEVSETTLVPLYGRGTTRKSSEHRARNHDMVVPKRPPGPSNWQMLLRPVTSFQHSAHPFHDRTYLHQMPSYDHRGTHSASPILGMNGTNTTVHPIVGMLGEMVWERVFGSSASIYNYRNSYQLAGSDNPRVRRQMMEADKGLERMCFFLFCGAILCLFLF